MSVQRKVGLNESSKLFAKTGLEMLLSDGTFHLLFKWLASFDTVKKVPKSYKCIYLNISPIILGCGNRFTHANRHCPKHPFSRLKREEPQDGQGKTQSVDNKAVAEWLAK